MIYTYRYFGFFRFFLAAIVMFQHFAANAAPAAAAHAIRPFEPGSLAVLAFFCLSGFVIAESADTAYRGRAFAFFTNRLLRVFPHFIMATLLSLILQWQFMRSGILHVERDAVSMPASAFSAANILANLVSILPYADHFTAYKFIPIAWAVRVEMVFYLVVAACLLNKAALSKTLQIACILFMPVFTLSVTGYLPPMFGFIPYFSYGAALYFSLQGKRAGGCTALISLIAITWHFFSLPPIHPTLGFARNVFAQYAILLFMILGMTKLAAKQFPRLRCFDGLTGTLTYPLYMYHYVVMIITASLFPAFSYATLIGGMVASIVFSTIMARLLDPCIDYFRNRVRGVRLAAFALFFIAAFPQDGFAFSKGVSLHGPFTWGRSNAEHTAYVSPVYEGEHYAVPVNLLQQAKAAGFDFIRLTVDPGPFLALKGAERKALDALLLKTVSTIRQTGLDVVVDFHPISLVSAFAPKQLETNDLLFSRYVTLIQECAGIIAKLGDDHIAIEPINEPQLGYNPKQIARWQQQMEALYRAVRAVAPEMTIIVTGGRGGSMEGLMNLDPAPFDTNTLFSFHYYLPYLFTHQGTKGSNANARIWPYLSGLPYPADAKDFTAFWQHVEERITDKVILESDKKQVEAYFTADSRAAIQQDFARIHAWAEQHHIPPERIFLGEFSATQASENYGGAAPADRARWIRDIRKAAEANGFAWAFWNLHNAPTSHSMTLAAPPDETILDKVTLKALGLGL